MDLIAQHQLDKASQIYYCVVKSVDDNQCTIVFNNKQYTVPYYGGKPTPNKTYAIFLPHNNMNESFVIGDGKDGGTEGKIIPISEGGTGADNAADARINLGLGNAAIENVVPLNKGGTGATTAAQAAKNLGVLPLGEVVTKIPFGADLNDYVLPGIYAVSGNNIAATITNIPSQSAGTLRVFASIGDTITASSTWKYLIQEYITLSGTRYQRYGESGSGTAVTWSTWNTIYTSADISVPVSVSQGGTGADNAASARTNLGAVSKSGDTMTGDLSVQKNGEASIYSNNTAQGRNIRLCAGASGRAGIYDDTHEKWLIDYDSAGVLELGDALPISSGGTGASNIAAARANLQAAQMIGHADLAGYGLSVSGTAYNFTLAQLFQAVPSYSRVVIPWIQSQNTTRYSTLAAELPAATEDFGMLVLDKAISLGEFRFIQYSSSKIWHGSYTTTNSRGFNGWWSDQRVLLWTNPTPSTLAAGTQNFSMSGYSQIEIECTRAGSTSETYFVRSGIGTSSSAVTVDLTTIRLETGNSNLNAITLMTRTADVYSSGIVFSSGQMIYNGALYTNWDNRAVPYRVWGIR